MAPNRSAAPAAPVLRIRLLGGVELRHDGAEVPPAESARVESLLAYLLLRRGRPQPRQRLAFLLWPDSTEPQARTNLRHVLHRLRRWLPEPERFLESTARTLAWRAEAPYWLDVAAFEESLDRAARSRPHARIGALRQAVELYSGDLLEGGYDEWLLAERDRLRQRHTDALHQLADLHLARREPADAIRYAEQVLRADPLREETYRLLIRAYHERGDAARALQAYHRCASTLERELGVGPSQATRRLRESLVSAPSVVEPSGAGPPLIGRGAERARLVAAWHDVSVRGPALVLVTGEPGIGKTRLVEEFARWCGHRGGSVASARCYPVEGSLGYGPVVAWLRSGALQPRLRRLPPARITELARLLPELLVPGTAAPQPLPEAEQRQRLFDAVAAVILAGRGPLLLTVDDLHWCDRQTLRLLHYLLRIDQRCRLLVAATALGEDLADTGALPALLTDLRAAERLTEIGLDRLTPDQTAALAGRLATSPPSPAEVSRLYRETEGNPLFVIEAARAGASSPRVQAVIAARLARLSRSARELAGLAATIGREFTSEVLAAASDRDDAALVRDLDELWRRHIIREQGPDGYDFSHDKLREVAYQDLSPVRRRRHHRRVAEALRRDPEPDPGLVAGHYERAGALDAAVRWYARAAEAAQRLHANAEAVRHLEHAIDLVRGQRETRLRQEMELRLLTAMPAPLGSVDGYSSRRLHAVQERAQELASRLGVPPAPPMLRSLAIVSLVDGDFAAAEDSGERLLDRAEHEADEMLAVEASYVLGIAAFWRARFVPARRHFTEAVRRYRPEQATTHLLRYGLDPSVVCLSRLGNTEWFIGHPRRAVASRDAGLSAARRLGHPFSTGVALVFAALLAVDMDDPAAVRRYAADLASLADLTGPNRTMSSALHGYLDVLDGAVDTGVGRIQATIEQAAGGQSAPGQQAALHRMLLAAYQAAGDSRGVRMTARRLLGMGGGAAVWHPAARRALAASTVASASASSSASVSAEAEAEASGQASLPASGRVRRGTLAERPGGDAVADGSA